MDEDEAGETVLHQPKPMNGKSSGKRRAEPYFSQYDGPISRVTMVGGILRSQGVRSVFQALSVGVRTSEQGIKGGRSGPAIIFLFLPLTPVRTISCSFKLSDSWKQP
jgi:hypothetical protein